MNRRLRIPLAGLLLAVFLTGCGLWQTDAPDSSPEVSIVTEPTQEEQFSFLAGESVLALVLLNPTQEELELAGEVDSLWEPDEYSDAVLVLPKEAGSTITVERVTYDEERDCFAAGGTEFKKTLTRPGALLIHTMLPEGIPYLRVTVSSETRSGSYDLSYYGRGNRRDFYIMADEN